MASHLTPLTRQDCLALDKADPLAGFRQEFDLPEGTIYPALHRLESAGLLESRWIDPPVGRKRRVYALTASGNDALRNKREGWSKFAGAVDALMGKPCPA